MDLGVWSLYHYQSHQWYWTNKINITYYNFTRVPSYKKALSSTSYVGHIILSKGQHSLLLYEPQKGQYTKSKVIADANAIYYDPMASHARWKALLVMLKGQNKGRRRFPSLWKALIYNKNEALEWKSSLFFSSKDFFEKKL